MTAKMMKMPVMFGTDGRGWRWWADPTGQTWRPVGSRRRDGPSRVARPWLCINTGNALSIILSFNFYEDSDSAEIMLEIKFHKKYIFICLDFSCGNDGLDADHPKLCYVSIDRLRKPNVRHTGLFNAIFTVWLHVMQRTVLWRSFCPSVKHMDCGKTKYTCAHILTPRERTFILVLVGEEWHLPEILGQTDPVRARTLTFNRYSLVAPQL